MSAAISKRIVVLFAFLLGPIGVLAPKGVVVLLVVAGLAGLAHWVGEKRPKLPVSFPIAVSLGALALWLAVSAAWAVAPAEGLSLVARLVGLTLAGIGLLFLVSRANGDDRHKAENAFLSGMVLGLAALATGFVYARITGDSLWGNYSFDPLTTLNNGAVTISLLAWPALAMLWARDRRWTASIAMVAVFLGFTFLSSGAALLAPIMGASGFLVVWFTGRRGAIAVAVVVAGFALAAPTVVSTTLSPEKIEGFSAKLPPSAIHRIKMWAFAIEKIDEKPLWGWGMDASRSIPQEDRRLAYNMEIMPLHPHNAFLQVRLELGVPGAVLTAVLLGVFFTGVVGNAKDRFAGAVMAGASGAYLTVAAISYGIWQNWWVAFAWALAALTSLAVRPLSSEVRTP